MVLSFVAATLLTLNLGSAHAKPEEFGSPKEAQALVAKAVASLKKAGAQKTYEAITAKAPGFVDRDLYVTAYDLEGKCLAQGANAKMVGKDLTDLRDADGRLFIKERMELAKTKGSFWQDYKWTDPVTRKVMAKTTYCERLAETVLCVGVYKR
jgi:signal transduction histidine kinase